MSAGPSAGASFVPPFAKPILEDHNPPSAGELCALRYYCMLFCATTFQSLFAVIHTCCSKLKTLVQSFKDIVRK
jgi:hypothetical protein